MPIMSKTYRRSFRWREQDGVPVAEVTVLNGRLYCWTCPACGCIHELIGGELGQPFKPDCLLRRLANMAQPVGRPAEYGANWRRLLDLWHEQYPAARAHDTVLLLDADAVAALDQAQQAADRLAAAQQRQDAAQQRKNERARAARAAAGKTRGRPRKDVAA